MMSEDNVEHEGERQWHQALVRRKKRKTTNILEAHTALHVAALMT